MRSIGRGRGRRARDLSAPPRPCGRIPSALVRRFGHDARNASWPGFVRELGYLSRLSGGDHRHRSCGRHRSHRRQSSSPVRPKVPGSAAIDWKRCTDEAMLHLDGVRAQDGAAGGAIRADDHPLWDARGLIDEALGRPAEAGIELGRRVDDDPGRFGGLPGPVSPLLGPPGTGSFTGSTLIGRSGITLMGRSGMTDSDRPLGNDLHGALGNDLHWRLD